MSKVNPIKVITLCELRGVDSCAHMESSSNTVHSVLEPPEAHLFQFYSTPLDFPQSILMAEKAIGQVSSTTRDVERFSKPGPSRHIMAVESSSPTSSTASSTKKKLLVMLKHNLEKMAQAVGPLSNKQ